MNSRYVLDASALLCLIRAEPGAQTVAEVLPDASISAVNLSETIAKLAEIGMDKETIDAILSPLQIQVHPFDEAAALVAGLLRVATRPMGLSFGDRACLALARGLAAEAVTTDRAWSALNIGVPIRMAR